MYWCVESCLESKALGLNFMLLRSITFLLLIYGSPNNLIPVTSQVLSDPHSIFNYPRHQHAATCLKNIRLNERWGKKLDINLLNKQPLNAVYRHSLLEITHEKKNIYERKRKFLTIEIYPGYKDTWNKVFFSNPNQDKLSLKSSKNI